MKGLVFGLLIALTTACTPPKGWKPMSMEELIPKYPLIMLATLKDSVPRAPSLVGGQKTYQIFCVLKGDNRPVPAMITMDDPSNPCVGIPPGVGQSFIIALSRTNDTAFTWWKDAGLESIVYDYTKENLATFMEFCEQQNPTTPDDQQISGKGNMTCPEVTDRQRSAICSGTNLSVKYLFISLCVFFAFSFMKK